MSDIYNTKSFAVIAFDTAVMDTPDSFIRLLRDPQYARSRVRNDKVGHFDVIPASWITQVSSAVKMSKQIDRVCGLDLMLTNLGAIITHSNNKSGDVGNLTPGSLVAADVAYASDVLKLIIPSATLLTPKIVASLKCKKCKCTLLILYGIAYCLLIARSLCTRRINSYEVCIPLPLCDAKEEEPQEEMVEELFLDITMGQVFNAYKERVGLLQVIIDLLTNASIWAPLFQFFPDRMETLNGHMQALSAAIGLSVAAPAGRIDPSAYPPLNTIVAMSQARRGKGALRICHPRVLRVLSTALSLYGTASCKRQLSKTGKRGGDSQRKRQILTSTNMLCIIAMAIEKQLPPTSEKTSSWIKEAVAIINTASEEGSRVKRKRVLEDEGKKKKAKV